MKMMEILKLWIRCIVAANQSQKKPIMLRELVILARAAQEYYTSGLHAQDAIDELESANTHPYVYDDTPFKPQGLAKIADKYNIKKSNVKIPEDLANAISDDIYKNTISKNGHVNYGDSKWYQSRILRTPIHTDYGYISARDGLVAALGKMLAAAQQK